MVFELVLGFLVLVAASYMGTMMALRGFFGRNYYEPSDGEASDGGASDGPPGPENSRKRDERRREERRRDGTSSNGDPPGTDDVPRAGDLSRDDTEDE